MDSEKRIHFAEKLAAYRIEQQRQLGGRLKEERKRLGLSLVEFARRAGIHRNTQANYESGQREPDQAYYEAAAFLGVRLTYIMEGEAIEELPRFAAGIANEIFRLANTSTTPDAMSNLFYLFGQNTVHVSSGLSQPFSDEQARAMVQAAFQMGEVFFEVSEAVFKYSWQMGPPPHGEKPSPQLWAELILEVLKVYSEIEGRPPVSLRDTVRLIAEDLIDSRAAEARQDPK